jgi:hypothetical protein
LKKPTFRENIELLLTDLLTAVTTLKNAETNVHGVAQDLATLNKMETPDPRDFIHKANVLEDPKREIALIYHDFPLLFRRLDEAEALLKQRRAELQELQKLQS